MDCPSIETNRREQDLCKHPMSAPQEMLLSTDFLDCVMSILPVSWGRGGGGSLHGGGEGVMSSYKTIIGKLYLVQLFSHATISSTVI